MSMFNLELFDLAIQEGLPEKVCFNASHVLKENSFLFILKNGRIEIYDTVEGICKHFDSGQELPEFKCITSFKYLTHVDKLWFGTGWEFVCICPFTSAIHFRLLQEKEFYVAEWNESQDVLAVIWVDGEITTYAVDFNSYTLLPLHSAQIDDVVLHNAFNDIGWGSENTQFDHSKIKNTDIAKKGLSNCNEQEEGAYPEESRIVGDDLKPRLCWKPDGKMFAVNYYDNDRRSLKVFSSDCKLLYVYNDILGLQPIFSWHPFSTKMCIVVWTNKEYSFIFLGRSSLERHVFELQNQERIEEIKWNVYGRELAIRQCNTEGLCTISLYTFLNYEWYLKQSIHFTADNPLCTFEFVKAQNQCILRTSTFNEIVTYCFKNVVHHSDPNNSKNGLTVAVINGSKVCLSYCQEGVIPSPLCNLIICTKNPINFIAFHSESLIAVLDAFNILSIYKYSRNSFNLLYEFNLSHLVSSKSIPLQIRNLQWNSDKQIIYFKYDMPFIAKKEPVYFLTMNGDSKLWNFKSLTYDGDVHYVKLLQNSESLLLQNGKTFTVLDAISKSVVVLPLVPLKLDVTFIDSNPFVFGLTATHTFMINEVICHRYVSSFIIHKQYLILVTQESQLIVARLDVSSLEKLGQSEFDDFYVRSIDRGGQLLFVIPNTSNIILENRRGNLELYTCRLITIDRVEFLIKRNEWHKALSILRLEKVNPNVIVDLDIQWFLDNVDIFITDVESQGLLNEFLVSLEDDNLLYTIYKECAIKSTIIKNKCATICKALIKSMQKHNYIHFITSIAIAEIMTADDFSVRRALEHIAYLIEVSNDENTYADIAKTTLQILQSLKPDMELYNTALATYNLELAIFVATSTSITPTEYQPLITALSRMDECRRRFTINKHLKRFREGLPYCIKLDNDEELYQYIVEYNLAKFAYPLLKGKHKLFRKVLNLYILSLTSNKKYDEAAAICLSVGFKTEALALYCSGLYWKKALNLMQELHVQPVEQSQILAQIVNGLIGRGNILEASCIISEHLHNYEAAIELLLHHHLYNNAIDIAQQHSRSDIIEYEIKIGIENFLKKIKQRVLNVEESFRKYKNRLVELRNLKQNVYTKTINYDCFDEDAVADDDDDLKSLAATTISTMSTNTSRTGFTKKSNQDKKAERKKEFLKEGSHFEDIALMKTLYKLIEETFKYGPQIRETILTSIAANFELTALRKEVHNSLLLLQKYMDLAVADIWPNNMNGSNTLEATIFMYQNIYELDIKYRVPPLKRDMDWSMDIFKELEEPLIQDQD